MKLIAVMTLVAALGGADTEQPAIAEVPYGMAVRCPFEGGCVIMNGAALKAIEDGAKAECKGTI